MKYKNEINLFYSRFGSRIDSDGKPHPRTVLTERGIAKERTATLSSVQPEETVSEESGTNEGNRRKWIVLLLPQGIARWKSNNNIFNSTNEFCFSYLFRIPRRLKCSLGCLLHYLFFHPRYFFSPSTFGHQGVGEGETEETMQFHL